MDHDHDDGLVHAHGWATEPPPSVGELLRPANDDRRMEPRPVAAAMNMQQDETPDEALVHPHRWARG